jgi:hypothetical protein
LARSRPPYTVFKKIINIERLNSSSSTKPTKKVQDWNTFIGGHRTGKTAAVPEKQVLRFVLYSSFSGVEFDFVLLIRMILSSFQTYPFEV